MTRDRSRDIAVTGLAARFAGPARLDGWWSAVTAGQVLTTRYARDELAAGGVPSALLDDPDYVPVHGHLTDADRFENALFRVSPREAQLMDPQHRLMLETAWAALEDAGVAPLEGLPRAAVYASASGSGYLRRMLEGGPMDPARLDDVLHATEPDFMASRIAYKLGLTGPAIAVQCACSSSLVALHLAIIALNEGDCDLAVVVGAGVPFPQAGYLHVAGGIHSASGACRPFDERADGTVEGSGVAAVVLRRLADLTADGPQPHGVVLGTAINNDGAAKAGYFAPSADGQEAVIRGALRRAAVDADSVGYLETHGTGTWVGDPIEWSAASSALAALGARPGQVAVGAVKANIGHLDAAAGIASLVKALLVLKTGVVPPVAGFSRLNPLLEGDASPLWVPMEARRWTQAEPRRAGVSAFGIGGTNAHAIVEQAPDRPVRRSAGRPRLVLLSAADSDALARSALHVGEHLSTADDDLADVSFTLGTARAELAERVAVAGSSTADVADRLLTGRGVVRGRASGQTAPAVFLFPGQGAQYPGMAVPLGEAVPGFTAALDGCLRELEPSLEARVRRALLDPDFPAEQIRATELAQPALFAIQTAAADALRGLGVEPTAVVGHSIGELSAACSAGVLERADAARVVAVRARAMQECPEGAMLALACGEKRALELVADSGCALELAAVNSPERCVLAGAHDAATTFESWLGERVPCKRLRTSHAFHSSWIAPALPQLESALATVSVRPPRIAIGANSTGTLVAPGEKVPRGMFVDQARKPVRFADAIRAVVARFPDPVLVELPPGAALSVLTRSLGLRQMALGPNREADSARQTQLALGALWTHGQPVARRAVCADGRATHLPAYPFYGPSWIAPEAAPSALEAAASPRSNGDPAVDSAYAAAGGQPAAARRTGANGPSVPQTGAKGRAPAPADAASALLARLWAELLGHAELNDDADFFDLGGDSLVMTHLVRRLNRELGVDVPIRAMLANPTLARQTSVVVEHLS